MPVASAVPVDPLFPCKGGSSNSGAAGFGAGPSHAWSQRCSPLARSSSSCAAQPAEQHYMVCYHARECLCRPPYFTICMLRIVIGAAVGTGHLGSFLSMCQAAQKFEDCISNHRRNVRLSSLTGRVVAPELDLSLRPRLRLNDVSGGQPGKAGRPAAVGCKFEVVIIALTLSCS